jgi:hypothetical protein
VRAALLVVALVAAGCGAAAGPRIPRALASDWRARADEIAAALAAHDACRAHRSAVRLQQEVIAAINRGTLPPRFQEPLLGAVNDLAARAGCG